MQTIAAIVDVIDAYLYLEKCKGECSWSGIVSHVVAQAGRDMINANIDVRKIITGKFAYKMAPEEYHQIRTQDFRVCVAELLERLLEGKCYIGLD